MATDQQARRLREKIKKYGRSIILSEINKNEERLDNMLRKIEVKNKSSKRGRHIIKELFDIEKEKIMEFL